MRKKTILFVAIALGVILLSLLLVAVSVHAQAEETDDPNLFQMPYPNYFIAGGCHSDGWGASCALDLNSIPNEGPLYSPISGKVVAKGSDDGYGNTYLCLQNSRWRVCMLHGIYDLVNMGDQVTIGQRLGTEASIGNSTGAHTHLSVYDRSLGAWIDPRDTLNVASPPESGADQPQDTSLHPQPGPVDWNVIGVDAPGKFIPETTNVAQPAIEEITEYWQVTYIQNENPIRSYLAEIHWVWFAILSVCLVFLTGSRSSRHWWPLWLVLLTILVISFTWSRSPSQASAQTVISTETVELVFPDPPPRLSDMETGLVLPDPPQPAAESSTASNSASYADGECLVSNSYPQEILRWCSIITHYSLEYGHDPNLIAALILQESGGQEKVISQSGAVGLMQVMPRDGLAAGFMCQNGPCFANRPTIEELKNPEFNVQYGTRMLAGLINKTGNIREALKSYGPADVDYYYADIVLEIYNTHTP